MNVIINRLRLASFLISITYKGSSGSCNWTVTQTQLKRLIPCVGYSVSQCETGQIPDLKQLNVDREAVEKPSSLFSLGFQNRDEYGNVITGLNISWTPPQSASSLHRLEGFFLRLTGESDEGNVINVCRLFHIRNISLAPMDRTLVFNYGIYPMTRPAEYKIELFSLPWQSEEGDNAAVSYVSYHEIFKDFWNSSSMWLTTIHYKVDTPNTVEVTFEFAQRFQLDEYTIQLITPDDYSYKADIKRSESPDKQFGRMTFRDVEPGEYFIQVQPKDPDPFDIEHCVCYKLINQTKECERCAATTTLYFEVSNESRSVSEKMNIDKLPKSTDYSLPRTEILAKDRNIDNRFMTQESRSDSEKGKEMSVFVWIMIVVCVVFAVTFISTLVFFVWKRLATSKRKQQENGLLNESNCGVAKNQSNTNEDVSSSTIEPRKKRLLLLNAEDHPLHVEAVKQFLTLLQDFCHCDVIYPPHCLPEISQTNWKDWILKCLDKVDNILIVNSEAAFKIMKANRKNETYKFCSITATGHLFKDFLHEIIKEFKQNMLVEKYLLVSFDHTSPNFSLPEFPLQQLYSVPRQLPDMVRYLHNLMSDSGIHPIFETVLFGNVEATEDGLALNDVVTKAMRYEKSNVIWFSERFGQPYNRIFYRNDSGFNSVTDQNDDHENHFKSCTRTVSFSSSDGRDELGFYPPEDYIGSLQSLENSSDIEAGHGDFACMKRVLVSQDDENHLTFQPDQSLAILEETDETNVYTSDSEFSFYGDNDVTQHHFVSPKDLNAIDDLSVSISNRLRQINEESSKF